MRQHVRSINVGRANDTKREVGFVEMGRLWRDARWSGWSDETRRLETHSSNDAYLLSSLYKRARMVDSGPEKRHTTKEKNKLKTKQLFQLRKSKKQCETTHTLSMKFGPLSFKTCLLQSDSNRSSIYLNRCFPSCTSHAPAIRNRV
jgi:hypothetical protein